MIFPPQAARTGGVQDEKHTVLQKTGEDSSGQFETKTMEGNAASETLSGAEAASGSERSYQTKEQQQQHHRNHGVYNSFTGVYLLVFMLYEPYTVGCYGYNLIHD